MGSNTMECLLVYADVLLMIDRDVYLVMVDV